MNRLFTPWVYFIGWMIGFQFLGCSPALSAAELPRLVAVEVNGATTVTPGGSVAVRYRFQDGSAAISAVTLVFTGPDGVGRSITSEWAQGGVAIPITTDWLNGTYTLNSVFVQTLYGRSVNFAVDGSVNGAIQHPIAAGVTPRLDGVRFTVTGGATTYEAPRLTTLSRSGGGVLTPTQGGQWSYGFSSGSAALTSLRLRLRDPQGHTLTVALPVADAGTAALEPRTDWANGLYSVQAVLLGDTTGNLITYARNGSITVARGSGGTHALDFASLDFTVANATGTVAFPTLTSIGLAGPVEVGAGERVNFSFAVQPGSSPVQSVTITAVGTVASETILATSERAGDGAISLLVPHDLARGRYTLAEVSITDAVGRMVRYSANGDVAYSARGVRESHAFDFRRLFFDVQPPRTGRLRNLAVRSLAGEGEQALIVGFNIAGEGNRPLLIRGIGPALQQFGLTSALADPTLALYAASAKVLENDDWAGNAAVASASMSAGAFALSDAASKDAALVVSTLSAGTYSVHVTGKQGARGTALAEVYDLGQTTQGAMDGGRLANLSARTLVAGGEDVLVAGFVIEGGPCTVLVRGVGPGLAQFGVAGTVRNPVLRIYAGQEKITGNDNWSSDVPVAEAFGRVGAFRLADGAPDAAMLLTLPVGSYTAQVSDANGGAGVGLIEVYEVR